MLEKKQGTKEKYQRDISAESSESTSSSFSRQTSFTFSESQPLNASQTSYLSSVNQSYDKLSINCDKNKSDFISSTNSDKSPTSNRIPLKCLGGFDKYNNSLPKFSQEDKMSDKTASSYRDTTMRKSHHSHLPSSSSSSGGMQNAMAACYPESYYYCGDAGEIQQKHRKKVSIDFGKATSFLKYPLKGDKKREKNKLNKFSSSESHLESSSESGSGSGNCSRRETPDDFFSESEKSLSGRIESQSVLGANHWMSQESSIHTFDSLLDLNFQPKWR